MVSEAPSEEASLSDVFFFFLYIYIYLSSAIASALLYKLRKFS